MKKCDVVNRGEFIIPVALYCCWKSVGIVVLVILGDDGSFVVVEIVVV